MNKATRRGHTAFNNALRAYKRHLKALRRMSPEQRALLREVQRNQRLHLALLRLQTGGDR